MKKGLKKYFKLWLRSICNYPLKKRNRTVNMMNKPKVSVITAVYNGERFLSEAIESVLGQTFRDFEYIIVDDGSTDKTSEIIKDFMRRDSRIITAYIENSGPANARNIALEMARADWIAVLDADDICLPSRLEEQVRFIDEHPECIFVGSGCMEITADGKLIKEHSYPCDHDKLVKNLERRSKFFPHSSNLYKRKVGSTIVRYDIRYPSSEDYNLWLVLSGLGKIGCVNSMLVKLRKHDSSISNMESGRLQMVMGMCAVVCHIRRKEGLSDPSQMGEDSRQRFLVWLKKRMEQKGVFQEKKSWQDLRNAYYSHNGSRLEGAKALMHHLLRNPKALKAIWRRIFKRGIALKLAEESKNIW